MCLAVPARIVAVDQTGDSAVVALGAIRKSVSLALVDEAAPGDYVLIHVGYALSRISTDEAEQTLALMREAGLVDHAGAPVEPAEEPAIAHPRAEAGEG